MHDSDSLSALLAAYLQAVDAGETPDRQALLDHHPGLAAELQAFFTAQDQLLDLARPVRAVIAPAAIQHQSDSDESSASRYRVVHLHARGGLGEVFVAEDTELHRPVALKEIQPRHATDPVSRSRFVLEAEITGRLEHPGIVPVYGLGAHRDGRPYYAMRFVQGESLAAAIERWHSTAERTAPTTADRVLAFRQLLGRFVAVCNAIAYAHSRGVIHRDLKPANVMLGKFGETLVVDWGLAKRTDARWQEGGTLPTAPLTTEAATHAGSVLGTPAYMSPEQAAGRIDLLGPATDIYSLGATLYCLLSGRAPFDRGDLAGVLRRVQSGEFPRPRQVNPTVPRGLEANCLKAMAREPADRYATAQALAEDVEHWLADEPVSAHREPWSARLGRWARHHRAAVAGGVAAFVVAVVAVSVGIVWQQQEQAAQLSERLVREAEANRTRTVAEERIRAALAQAETARDGLQKELDRPGGVFLLLNNASDWEGRLRTARAALDGATALTAGTGVTVNPTLVKHVEALDAALKRDESEQRLAVALSRARQRKSTARRGPLFDFAPLRQEYERLFREAGLALFPGKAEEIADTIRRSSVREQLVAALDDWSLAVGTTVDSKTLNLLQETVPIADPDPWRDRFREFIRLRTPKQRAELLSTAPRDRLSPAMLSLVGQFLITHGDDAVPWLRAAQALHPTDFQLNLDLGTLLTNSRSAADAIGFLRAAAAIQPDSSTAHHHLASALAQVGQLDAALLSVRRALQIEPEFPLALALQANLFLRQGNAVAALQSVQRAIDLLPDYAPAHRELGNALDQLKKLPEALNALEKAVQLDPTDPQNHLTLGLHWLGRDRPREAIVSLQRALELDPEESLAWGSLCRALCLGGRHEDAITLLKQVLKRDPYEGAAHSMLGLALAEVERFAEARDACRKALELLSPREQSAHRVVALKVLALVERNLGGKVVKRDAEVVSAEAARAGLSGKLAADDPFDDFPLTRKSHHRAYAVQLAGGKSYRIDLAAKFDAFLRVEDAAGKHLLHNDDASPPRDLSARLIFTPKDTGPYRLVVTSFQPAATGPYTLRVQEAFPAGDVRTIRGKLAKKNPKDAEAIVSFHEVELKGGLPHTIDLESEGPDMVLLLLDPKGDAPLARSPEAKGGRDRLRIDFTPPVTMTYTLAVTTWGSGKVGGYLLRIQAYNTRE